MRYLVTGGLGVIGSRFVDRVVRSGGSAIVLDCGTAPRSLHTRDRLRSYGDRVTLVEGRVETTDFVPLLKECDAVLHAAAHTGIPHSESDPGDDWASNVDGTFRLMSDMFHSGIRRPTVVLSSVKPYKASSIPSWEDRSRYSCPDEFPGVNEDFPMDPDEPYAASKMAQSALSVSWSRTFDLPVATLRCSNLYGDAPCHGPRHGWLTWFCISAVLDRAIEVQGSGKQTRDMLFCEDVTDAVLACIDGMDRVSGRVFNIGGGLQNTISCVEAVDLLSRILGRPVKVVPGPGRKREDMIFFTDHDAFTRATGWTPKVYVRDGMSRIVDWATRDLEALKGIYGT